MCSTVLAAVLACGIMAPGPADLAKTYTAAVRRLNEGHARAPGKTREEELARKLPAAAGQALDRLLASKGAPDLASALAACGEGALDLDRIEDFDRIRARLEEVAPDEARKLGVALSRPRFLLRGMNSLDRGYLERFAVVLEAVLGAYDEVFGFAEWSKVPGKKLRLRLHLEEKITRPPHFAPQHPFHSEIDFPVADREALRSPTRDGKFLFYGLCHELGHVIAMWGNGANEEDRHSWAHYTGVVIVEHLAKAKDPPPFLKDLRDVNWRSLDADRKRLDAITPSLKDYDGILALLIALHDRLGAKALGDAINLLDRRGNSLRINHVRHYNFKELRAALLELAKDAAGRKMVEGLMRV